MAPKKADQPKKKKTTVDDKTFGMKNKKGGAAKKQIQQLQAQSVSNKTPDDKRKAAEKLQLAAEKKAAEDAKREAADLFKPIQAQKVPFGVDPKTVLCLFHKKGGCEKGRKCKFSHDLNIERKAAKKDLYTDSRDNEGEGEGEDEEGGGKKADKMEDWDEEKLRSVVLSKHGNPRTTTDKVCKYFIEAVENQKYGWFWTCPNGGNKCMYKHSLPPGFVLKTKEQKAAEKALMDKSPLATLTLEDWLESERHRLTGTLTPVTPETFAKWKKERIDKKTAESDAQRAKEATGRAMFEDGAWKEEDESSDEEDEFADLVEQMKQTQLEKERQDAEEFLERTGQELPPGDGRRCARPEGRGRGCGCGLITFFFSRDYYHGSLGSLSGWISENSTFVSPVRSSQAQIWVAS
ncbi:Translation machinery-associated protein 46 [Penicillium waksmanii]|uniref:Translation machinery-associated protein 46 n=1 Tax=Penicillium waksmanii TaxID=69791 RepID=UPI00254990A8|nr:Translation machinery-associated protein 46 [Penicillium waksmanii]KAJ5980672.1 Translation machinery-associated protein 46 [Penicillium waksmanii]